MSAFVVATLFTSFFFTVIFAVAWAEQRIAARKSP
jgi:hypothetical protein